MDFVRVYVHVHVHVCACVRVCVALSVSVMYLILFKHTAFSNFSLDLWKFPLYCAAADSSSQRCWSCLTCALLLSGVFMCLSVGMSVSVSVGVRGWVCERVGV